MRRHKTITISLPTELVDYLDCRIKEINKDTFEETNRSKYIRLLIRKDMHPETNPQLTAIVKDRTGINKKSEQDTDYYNALLQLGGYKR